MDAGGGRQDGRATVAAGNFNATGFPIVNEPITKRFMMRRPPHITDPTNMVTLQRYEQMTNVRVQWEAVPTDGWSERVNLVMASNDMPDAIMKGVPDITRTSEDGSIIDLTDLMNRYPCTSGAAIGISAGNIVSPSAGN